MLVSSPLSPYCCKIGLIKLITLYFKDDYAKSHVNLHFVTERNEQL